MDPTSHSYTQIQTVPVHLSMLTDKELATCPELMTDLQAVSVHIHNTSFFTQESKYALSFVAFSQKHIQTKLCTRVCEGIDQLLLFCESAHLLPCVSSPS